LRKKGRPGLRTLGFIAIAAGAFILMAMILPSGFWWFAAAIALIILGVRIIRRA
jgi:hypothetical protein